MAIDSLVVYGSCVSRDTVDLGLHLPKSAIRLYVARQSLISAFSPAATLPKDLLASGNSPFQNRMLLSDATSALPDLLTAATRTTVDLLLWDLTDERLGVYLFDDGSTLTRSIDMIGTPLEAHAAASGRLLRWGSPEHLDRWVDALTRFDELVSQLAIARTVMLDIPWANNSANGNQTPTSFGMTADQANQTLRPYVDAVRGTSFARVTSLTDLDVRSDSEHRWGNAPFHYTAEVYAQAAVRISSICEHDEDSNRSSEHR